MRYVALAVTEGRHRTAARLLGFADHAAERRNLRALDGNRVDRIRTTLEGLLDATTLQQLMAQGRVADEEAVCRWTLQVSDEEVAR